MSILRRSRNKLRPFAALIATFALLMLSLGSALAHSTAGGGAGGSVPALSITSLTDNGDVDEAKVDEDAVRQGDDDANVDQADDETEVDENDQGENADENDQGEDEQADENDDDQGADENDDSNDKDEADDGDSHGGGDENEDDGGEGGDD